MMRARQQNKPLALREDTSVGYKREGIFATPIFFDDLTSG
jgi:hypothetical protein